MEDILRSHRDRDRFSSYSKPIEEKFTAPNITWEHIWSYNEIRDGLLKSEFIKIPNEIMLRIFKPLCVHDLCNVSLVCRRFKMIVDQDEIWELKCSTSTRLYSKSVKHIYMNWIYTKCLRNAQLKRSRNHYRLACLMRTQIILEYPIRPIGKHQFEVIGGFHQHPNSSSSMTINLSVDIEKTARELIKLLEKASIFYLQWEESIILKQMIIRYYRFMQLKAFYPSNILLVPTLDIEIVWQTHILRPEIYQSDCLRLFHRVINHSLLISNIEKHLKEQAFRDTCYLYEQKFNEQYCPLPLNKETNNIMINSSNYRFDSNKDEDPTYSYWDTTQFEFSSDLPKNYENPFSFTEGDLIMDNKWLDLCKEFMSNAFVQAGVGKYYHNISKGIDLESKAMKKLKKSYERFLYMAAKYPLNGGNGFIPPTYAIDIMWHSHMEEPLNYASDCIRLVGYVIYHDPWPMIEDDKMKEEQYQANKIWKNEFEADIMTDHLLNTIDDDFDWNN